MRTFDTRDDMVIALLAPGSVVAEIGVFEGSFSKTLLRTHPKKLFLVDPWEGHVSSGNADGNDVVTWYLPAVYSHLCKAYACHDTVELVRARSSAFFQSIPDRSLDAVYLDGDHSYEGVAADLEHAARVVKPGGWVMGHDYAMNMQKARTCYNFGVEKAVTEFCDARGLRVDAVALDGCVSFAIRLKTA